MLGKLLQETVGVISLNSTTNNERSENERFLPDEERILRLLAEHDGKLWQRGLIEETGWSASKMSRTLSAMEEQGRIDRKQIGREKLVIVPESTAVEQGGSSGQSVPINQFTQ